MGGTLQMGAIAPGGYSQAKALRCLFSCDSKEIMNICICLDSDLPHFVHPFRRLLP